MHAVPNEVAAKGILPNGPLKSRVSSSSPGFGGPLAMKERGTALIFFMFNTLKSWAGCLVVHVHLEARLLQGTCVRHCMHSWRIEFVKRLPFNGFCSPQYEPKPEAFDAVRSSNCD